jgi:hypothetical protein
LVHFAHPADLAVLPAEAKQEQCLSSRVHGAASPSVAAKAPLGFPGPAGCFGGCCRRLRGINLAG